MLLQILQRALTELGALNLLIYFIVMAFPHLLTWGVQSSTNCIQTPTPKSKKWDKCMHYHFCNSVSSFNTPYIFEILTFLLVCVGALIYFHIGIR